MLQNHICCPSPPAPLPVGEGRGEGELRKVRQLLDLLQKATPAKDKDVKLECKHFFSGAAVYANGRICMSLTPAGFALKLPEEACDTLLKKGAKRLRYFPDGPIKKDYVVLPTTMLNDTKTLRRWMRVSVAYALTLPEPVRKKGGVKVR